MNSHIEEEELLTIGKHIIDVSNVSAGRSMKGLQEYNKAVKKVYDEKLDTVGFNLKIDKIGLYLIRHDYDSLKLRFNVIETIKEIIKRKLITTKDIRRFTVPEYTDFHGWVYFKITGKKKEDLETEADMTEIATKFYQEMKKLGVSQERCLELLPTLAKELARQLKDSTTDQTEF